MRTLLNVAAATLVVTSLQTPPAPAWESAEEMHDIYVRRFESLPGFGLSRMWQPPMQDLSGVLDTGRGRYTLNTIELVGLLKKDPPVVYTGAQHPAGNMPHTFKSRKLTNFEHASVGALRTGKDVIADDHDAPATMRVVGALRAKSSCVRCHATARPGDLLGAFSYVLSSKKSK